MAETQFGLELVRQGCCQGAVYVGGHLPQALRDNAIATRSDIRRRSEKNTHKILDDDYVVILSQDCDIAAKRDDDEPLVEAAVFKKPRKEREIDQRNDYGNSARKLNLRLNGSIHIAEAKNIVWIPKESLASTAIGPVYQLSDDEVRIVKMWRANRYIREPFPDAFDALLRVTIIPERVRALHELSSCIRGIWLALDTYTETDRYQVALLAIVNHDISREDLKRVTEFMEDWCEDVDQIDGLQEASINNLQFPGPRNLDVEVPTPVLRENEISVAALSAFRRFNFDYISLGLGEDVQ